MRMRVCRFRRLALGGGPHAFACKVEQFTAPGLDFLRGGLLEMICRGCVGAGVRAHFGSCRVWVVAWVPKRRSRKSGEHPQPPVQRARTATSRVFENSHLRGCGRSVAMLRLLPWAEVLLNLHATVEKPGDQPRLGEGTDSETDDDGSGSISLPED